MKTLFTTIFLSICMFTYSQNQKSSWTIKTASYSDSTQSKWKVHTSKLDISTDDLEELRNLDWELMLQEFEKDSLLARDIQLSVEFVEEKSLEGKTLKGMSASLKGNTK
ncbi:MAG: hypothetical protein VX319_00220, partial [Bacteroidota bacterium]|nr:hypothetical protein [Bacteroidota bacterium]